MEHLSLREQADRIKPQARRQPSLWNWPELINEPAEQAAEFSAATLCRLLRRLAILWLHDPRTPPDGCVRGYTPPPAVAGSLSRFDNR